MNSIDVLITLFFALAITAIWFSINKKKIISSHFLLKKYFPFGLGFVILVFVTFSTLYFNSKKNSKIREFDKLKVIANFIDTSYQKDIELQSQPIDIYSSKKLDSIKSYKYRTDSVNRELKNIKYYLMSENIFSKFEPSFKDSLNSTIQSVINLQSNLKKTSAKFEKKNTPISGYVYAGNISNGKWNQNNFCNLTNNNDSLPRIGDTLHVVKPIFVRIGETHFQAGKGWVNQTLKGVLNSGEKIVVLEIVALPRDYYWIRY